MLKQVQHDILLVFCVPELHRVTLNLSQDSEKVAALRAEMLKPVSA